MDRNKYEWHRMEEGEFPQVNETICLLKSGVVISGFPYKDGDRYIVATHPYFEFEDPSDGECIMWMEMPDPKDLGDLIKYFGEDYQ